MMQYKFSHPQNGFALLLTLVVVSVVLAIGLSLLDITLKQLVLSGTGRDSEIAFQAAYAGRDCGNYWAKANRDDFISSPHGVNSAPQLSFCINNNVQGDMSDPTTNVHLAEYSITWASGADNRCTEIDIYVYDASGIPIGNPALLYDINTYGSGAERCSAGKVCTLVFSRGYNRGCSDTSDLRTIQREIVSQF